MHQRESYCIKTFLSMAIASIDLGYPGPRNCLIIIFGSRILWLMGSIRAPQCGAIKKIHSRFLQLFPPLFLGSSLLSFSWPCAHIHYLSLSKNLHCTRHCYTHCIFVYSVFIYLNINIAMLLLINKRWQFEHISFSMQCILTFDLESLFHKTKCAFCNLICINDLFLINLF